MIRPAADKTTPWLRRNAFQDSVFLTMSLRSLWDRRINVGVLFRGNAALAYSKKGFGYAMEKADTKTGWSFPVFEEAFNQGYRHELKHFIDCVRNNNEPLVTGELGRKVPEVIYAAYASAKQGKKIELPFAPLVKKPVDLWLS